MPEDALRRRAKLQGKLARQRWGKVAAGDCLAAVVSVGRLRRRQLRQLSLLVVFCFVIRQDPAVQDLVASMDAANGYVGPRAKLAMVLGTIAVRDYSAEARRRVRQVPVEV